jgi:hypothetical protein
VRQKLEENLLHLTVFEKFRDADEEHAVKLHRQADRIRTQIDQLQRALDTSRATLAAVQAQIDGP